MSKQYPEPKRANRWEFYRALALNEQAPELKKQRQELEENMMRHGARVKILENEVANAKLVITDTRNRIGCIDHDLNNIPILKLRESEIVTTSIFDDENRLDSRLPRIEECYVMALVRARGGNLKSLNPLFPIYVFYPRFRVPDGDYYILLTKEDSLIHGIQLYKEDASAFYRTHTAFIFDVKCKYCSGTTPTTCIHYYLPGLNKMTNGLLKDETQIYICSLCINKTPCEFNDLIKMTQKHYNNVMCYPAILTQLLYARVRLEDNPFHADELPLDIFKIIMRLVFPASFLTIK